MTRYQSVATMSSGMVSQQFNLFPHRHVREQVELLEDHSHRTPLFRGRVFGEFVQPIALSPVADVMARRLDRAGVDGFKMIDAVEQCALA